MIILIVTLAVMLAGALVGCFYFWKRCKQEENKKWDEISRSAGLENEIERIEEWKAKAKADYMLAKSETRNEHRRYLELQDKYSAVICPTNNHVWEEANGVKRCKKCGRAYNG